MAITIDARTYRKDQRFPHRHPKGHAREGFFRGYGGLTAWASPVRDSSQIRAILIHTTNGNGTNYTAEANYLATADAVSSHYIVDPHSSRAAQILPDTVIAWHAGDCRDNAFENTTSIGIEIAWTPSAGRLPNSTRNTVGELCAGLLVKYPSIVLLDTHRRQAVPLGRKSDPAGWPDDAFDAWRDAVFLAARGTPTEPLVITEHSGIIASPRCTIEQLHAALLGRDTGEYSVKDVHETIIPTYWRTCVSVNVDPCIAVAQMLHETSELRSFWAARPQRNPSGIGVDGQKQADAPNNPTGWAYNMQRQCWETGVSFKSWEHDAIPAHIGRLLAYALPLGKANAAQLALIRQALGYRRLPDAMRGSAPDLRRLGRAHNPTGQGWASPGDDYGQRIAEIANRIRTL